MKLSRLVIIIICFTSSTGNSQNVSALYKLIIKRTDSILRHEFDYTNPKLSIIDSIFINSGKDCSIRCQNDFKENEIYFAVKKINIDEIIIHQCYTQIDFFEFIEKFKITNDSTNFNYFTLKLHTFNYIDSNTLQTKILIYRAGQNPLIACFLVQNTARKGLFRKKHNWIVKDLCVKNFI